MRGWLTRSFATGSAVLALTLAGTAARAADLGSPPSGEIPILFNDHTVYAKPDILTDSRVLAALVKDGQLYVPLRSMFEAMGATVTASPDGKTVTATKSGASVSVTLGKAEVLVNGETRPLDVPPMLVNGIVLVPVRVLSEAMGLRAVGTEPPRRGGSLHSAPGGDSADSHADARPDTHAVAFDDARRGATASHGSAHRRADAGRVWLHSSRGRLAAQL